MKIVFVLSIAFLSIIPLYSEKKYNVLYLNSGDGQYKIEQNIYNGIYSNIDESTNITLYSENLSLYKNKNEIYKNKLADLLITKYSDINLDLLIILNYDALKLVKQRIISAFDNPMISYGEIIQFNKSDTIYENLNTTGLYSNNYLEETIELINKHHNDPKITLVLSPWEFDSYLLNSNQITKILDTPDNIEGHINTSAANSVIITGAYSSSEIIKQMSKHYTYSYWDTHMNLGLAGGFMQDSYIFGKQLAYKGKLLILNIDLSPEIKSFPDYKKIIDFEKQNKVTIDDLYKGIIYLNRPKSKFEEDKFLIWKIAVLTSISVSLIIITIIILSTKKRRSRLIIETEQQLYSLINSLPLPIHARDKYGKYLFVNDKFLEINYIKNREDIINRTINNTPGLSPEEIKIFLKQDKDVLENNKVEIYETPFYDVKIKKNKLYKVYKNPHHFYDQECVLCILDDITELKNAEREVVELNKNLEDKIKQRTNDLEESLKILHDTQNELVETKKMASLTTLVVGIAHEMNTPLGIGLTQVSYLYDITKDLKNDYENENIKKSELKKYIDLTLSSETLVLNSLKKTITMINRFKEIAIQRDDRVSTFTLGEYIKQNLNIYLNSQNIQKIKLNVLDEEGLKITTFREAFIKVLENLIDNSISHGKLQEDGEITIKCKKVVSDVEISFIDNGVGIKDENVEKIFDPFYTTNRSEGQIGLGLSIVFAIIKNKLNGSIEYFTPSNGIGAGFKLILKDFSI